MKLIPDLSGGRGHAYGGIALGITISVAGNIAHAYVPPAGEPDTWQPGYGPVISAVIWPLILFLTFEIMLSVKWPDEWYFHFVRWGVLGVVAGVAAVVSYQHLSGLLKHWDETEFAWKYGPLAVDGLLVMSSIALVLIRLGARTPDPKPPEVPETPAPVKKIVLAKPPEIPKPPEVPVPVPVPAPTNGNGHVSGNAKLILDALPGTVSELATKTGVGRTTVEYALKNTLAKRVRQDGRVWRTLSTEPLS